MAKTRMNKGNIHNNFSEMIKITFCYI